MKPLFFKSPLSNQGKANHGSYLTEHFKFSSLSIYIINPQTSNISHLQSKGGRRLNKRRSDISSSPISISQSLNSIHF
ncbi:hypothetical protein VNO77_11055 [Canavalia gladiata]|uniref:Uncharacterized protein n=1 Tax=Canavalia gladiata TaxID=3824 RepID=A0AAN9QXH3_CANGL